MWHHALARSLGAVHTPDMRTSQSFSARRRGVSWRPFMIGAVLVSLGTGGCGSSGGVPQTDSPATDSPETDSPEVSENDNLDYSGQTGSIGQGECSTDEDCWALLEERVAILAGASPVLAELEATACGEYMGSTEAGEISGTSCECHRSDTNGTVEVAPSGTGCVVTGRMGDCLYDSSEFSGCTVGDIASCESTCAELESRLRDDAGADLEYELRYAKCGRVYCQSVVRIADECYTGLTMGTPTGTYDCSLSDEEILAREGASTGTSVRR